MKVNSSAGWKEEGLGGSNARPPRVYGPAVFNDSDPRCNDISVYYRMVDAQERSLMIPCPQYEIWQYCPAWKQIRKEERDTVLDIGEILESLCKTDLYWYNKGVTEGEDVGKCRGKDCNYCGRYNEKLRHQAGEP